LGKLKIFRSESNLEFDVVVIDDNSPDGTADIVDNLAISWVQVLHRPGKGGLGAAYRAGFNKILADMNLPSSSNPVMNAPSGRMIQDPNPNTTYPVSMDPATATAHMIGKDYPSPADFANMMHSPSYRPGDSSYAPIMSQQAPPTLMEPAKSNMYAEILTQVKQPLIVSLIVFLLSLPIVHVLIGHYVPSLLRIGGDLTTAGLVVKSLLGGFLFWFIQKVLVPLMVVS
jgi:hypothetical protein